MANFHSTGGPASFRPSGLFTKHKGTFETKRTSHSKRHKVFILRRSFEGKRIPTGALSTRPVTLPFYFSFSLTRSHSFLVTVREKLCCCDGPARELHWHCDHSEKGSPTTLSSPNTHPSFLGREGPLPKSSPCHSPSSQS